VSAAERAHRAKRFDEDVKLAATFFNATAILAIGTAFSVPRMCSPTTAGLSCSRPSSDI
jgi:branched-subunit amino acid permease